MVNSRLLVESGENGWLQRKMLPYPVTPYGVVIKYVFAGGEFPLQFIYEIGNVGSTTDGIMLIGWWFGGMTNTGIYWVAIWGMNSQLARYGLAHDCCLDSPRRGPCLRIPLVHFDFPYYYLFHAGKDSRRKPNEKE